MRESVASIVFARVGREPRRFWVFSAVFAVVFHAVVLIVALKAQPTLEFWASDLAQRVHAELGQTQNVTMAEETPPPPPPPVESKPPPPPPPAKLPSAPPAPTQTAAAHPGPQSPAEAGQIIAAEGPADLTGTTFVTGNAKAYAGGKTSATGKSKDYVAPETPTSPKGAPGPSYSEGIALADENWSCPWPHEADVSEVNKQSAVVRVMVSASGVATKASIVKDPGLGFGPAAADCAMKARFIPAKDAAGHPVASESSIRVRFER